MLRTFFDLDSFGKPSIVIKMELSMLLMLRY